jgi:hypothetical protein
MGVVALVGLAMTGCAREHKSTLTAADFSRSSGAVVEGSASRAAPPKVAREVEPTPVAPTRQPPVISAREARGGIEDVSGVVGEPGLDGMDSEDEAGLTPVGAGVLIEEKVGDVNGKPIYASRFFEGGLLERLIADRAKMDEAAWTRSTQGLVRDKLESLIVDELLKAEALASLSPVQKQGLRGFIRNWEEDVVRSNRGARSLAESRLESAGTTLDEQSRLQERKALIDLKLKELSGGVYVSRREIEIAFERQRDVYQPNPRATVRLIRVPASDSGAIAQVRDALNAGEPFAEVASQAPNEFKRSEGGLLVLDQEVRGAFEESSLTGIDEVNVEIRKLTPGAWAGPVIVGTNAWFTQLESLKQTDVPLEIAQLELDAELRSEELKNLHNEYLMRLINRASFTSVDVMTARLVEIAREKVRDAGA